MHMGKRFYGKMSVLASVLLLFQLVLPMVNALAAEPDAPTSTVETSPPADTPAPTPTTTPTDSTTPSDSTTPVTPSSPENTSTPADTTAPESTTTPTDSTTPADPTTPTDSTAHPVSQTPEPPKTAAVSTLLPPSNLAFTLLSPDDVKLTWSSVFGASGYNVYGIYDGEMRLLGATSSTSFTFNDASEGTYQFVVSTLSADGESGPCAPVSVDIVYPDMQAPATFTSKIQNGNDIVLNWTASQYAGTYNIYQIAADGAKTLVTTATGLTYTVSNAPDESFTYAISSTNSLYGESPLSSPTTIDVVHPTMTAPGHFAQTVTNGNDVNLKWDAVPFANSYKVYQVIDGQKVLQKTVSGTTTTLANLAAGDYTFAVTSNSDRYGESQQDSELTMTLVHPTMAAPANFKYTAANVNDITLSWAAVTYANSYKVYQIIDGQKVLQKTVTTTSAAFPAMTDGDYTFEVHAYSDRFGESAEGSQVTFTVDIPTMLAPGNFDYKVQNGNDIVLTWAAAANANSYKVYQVIDGQKVLKSTATGLIATFTNMAAGDYTYEVHSVSTRYGESAEGSKVTFNLTLPTMQAPANLTQTIANGNDIVLKWDAVTYANTYKVYQIVNGQKVLKSTVTTTTVTYANLAAGDYTYEVHAVSSRFGESAEGSQVTLSLVLPTILPPANMKQTITKVTDFTLSWDAAAYAASYKVYQVVNGQKTLVKTVTTNSVAFTGMNPGDYTYEVHTVAARFGESVEGSLITVTLNGVTMQAPTNLTNTITNGNDITLRWTAASYADSYKVYQIVDGQPVLKSTVAGTAVAYTNMPGGDYSYEVHSFSNRYGESQEGAQISFTLTLPTVASPGNLASKVQNGNDVVLTWTAATNANNYKVYEQIDGQNVLKQTVTALSSTLVNQAQGDHKYVVTAFNTRFGESQGSEVTLSVTFPTMQAPGNLTHTIVNVNDITLKWDAVQYVTNYKVYQVIDGQKVLQKTVTNATTTSIVNAPAGDLTYEVHSYSDRFGESPEGSQVTLTMVHPTMQAPGTLTQTIANGNDITLKWGASQYATAYKLYQIQDGQKVLVKTQTPLTITYPNMPAGDYSYEVHSYSDRFGESPEGTSLTFTLVHPTMQAPGTLTQTIANGNDITLKWGASQYATAYKLYQIKDGQKVLLKTQTALTITYPNMPAGDYSYVVYSYSDRFGESPEGSPLNFTLVHPTMQAPATFTQTIANGNDIALTWGSSQYATAYNLYQIKDGQKVLLKTQTTGLITYANMPQGDYSYEVHSYSNRFGESPEGNVLNFTLVHPTMQAPGTLTQTITNGNDITLKWGTAQYATAYNLYQVQSDGQKTLLKTQTTSTITYTNMPQGDYKYVVHSYSNRFGESPVGSELTFTLVHPVVQPPVLKDTVVNVNNLTFTWNAVTWANEYRLYKVNGETRELVYKGTALTAPVYNLTEGTHTYELTAFSARFGESVASNRITETIVYPDMQAPTATAKVLSTNSARISWNFVTYANGYNVYELVDDQPVLIAQNVNALSYTLNNLSYKNHLYYVASFSNSFGESDPSNTVLAKLVLDEVAPVTTANAPANWTQQSPVTVTLSATDNDTGVAKTYYALDGAEYATGTSVTISGEGVHKLSFYSVDRVDNKETPKTVEVKIDQTAPTTRASEVATWSSDVVALNLTATDNQSGVAKTYYSIDGSDYVDGSTLVVDKEGVNHVTFYSVDAAGNQEKPQTIDVKVDKTAPVTVSDATTNWSQADVQVTLTASDAQSGVAKTYYSVNGSDYVEGTSFTVDKEGVNKISFYSVDQTGNQEQAQTAEVKVDKTAPTTASNASDTWSKDNVTVTLAATDAQSGVAKTYYSINGADYVEGTSFTVSKEGVNKITFYSVDVTGNTEAVQKAEVKIDKTVPVVELKPSAEFKLGTSVKLTYTATDSQSGIAADKMTVSGPQGDQVLTNGASFTVNKPGVYTVTVTATDVVGLTTTVQKQFVVYIPATISVTPGVIKGNNGVFTVRVDLPSGFSTQGFDLNGVRLNGVKALTSNNGYYNQAKNGQFKFERSDFTWTPSAVTLEFRGYVDGLLVVGQTQVNVQK